LIVDVTEGLASASGFHIDGMLIFHNYQFNTLIFKPYIMPFEFSGSGSERDGSKRIKAWRLLSFQITIIMINPVRTLIKILN
jgi:hypothetical protein